jgi:hypothetical protein
MIRLSKSLSPELPLVNLILSKFLTTTPSGQNPPTRQKSATKLECPLSCHTAVNMDPLDGILGTRVGLRRCAAV